MNRVEVIDAAELHLRIRKVFGSASPEYRAMDAVLAAVAAKDALIARLRSENDEAIADFDQLEGRFMEIIRGRRERAALARAVREVEAHSDQSVLVVPAPGEEPEGVSPQNRVRVSEELMEAWRAVNESPVPANGHGGDSE